MSEEVQDQQQEEQVETQEAAPEAPAAEETPQEAAAKVKKINRLPRERLLAKIEDMEKKNMTQSTYYKHLIQRKNELEAV